ncbi:MAG: TM2 domain-containing protein [Planctomycetota bacterium]
MRKNPGVAIVLSFIFPGLGQFYNEEILKGILVMFCFFVSLMSLLIFIGFILAPTVWIVAMIDAKQTAQRINLSAQPAPPARSPK